jgi:hypothetical protein
LSGKTGASATGLSATTAYYFKVNVDATGVLEYTITTASTLTYTAVMALMNAQIGTAVFAIVGGDLRCTSNLIGTTSAIALSAGTTGTNLFATLTGWSAFDTAVAGSVASHFTDDSDDAKDLYEKDFQLGSTDANDGFYITCDYTFNRVVFKGAALAGGSPVAEYTYWGASGWTSLGTLVTTPVWTAAEGDKTLEFNLPLDSNGVILWETYGEDDPTSNVDGKYIIRVRFTTAASAAFSCDYLQLYNTQYLTQILQDERPHLVRSHNSQIYMASYNIVNFSPPYYVTGWREGQSEHFDEGGAKIIDMVSFADTLVVGKEHTIYTWTTSDLNDPVRSRPLTTVGPISSRSMAQIGNIVVFVARDGIYQWDGSIISKLSKHINTDIESWTLTNAASVVYKGECWITFPTNSVVLVFDPDTYRADDMGDARVSFSKFTSYKVTQFINCNGAGDTGYLLGIVDQAAPYVVRCDYGATDNLTGTATNIDMRCQTKYFSNGEFQTAKGYGRIKVKLKQVSLHSGEQHKFTMYADDGERYESVLIQATKGTGYYSEDVRVPYTVDGKLLSLEMRHTGPTSATLIGYAVETFERSY